MKLWLLLYKVIPFAHPRVPLSGTDHVDADVLGLEHPVFAKFAGASGFLPKRAVNWPQTFARRDLPFAAYRAAGSARVRGRLVHTFDRRAFEPSSLPPQVSFSQSVRPQLAADGTMRALQGEVLLCDHQLAFVRYEIPHDTTLTFHSVPTPGLCLDPDGTPQAWVTDRQELLRWKAHCSPADQPVFQDEILDAFDPAVNFVHIYQG